ncbi:MAG: peptidylprolyl isomerase [Candidatus Acidiferrum sp.]|jgi:peptidyl-prolyl cis-trans isomerase SurA
MKRVTLLAGILIAWPLLAQDPPAQNPPAQTPPQTPAPQTPPAQNPPALELPKMEEPGTAPDDTKTPPKKTDTPTPKVEKKAGASEGKVVEEIVARVNNEIITRSELDKARTSAADSAREDCNGRCTPEQLQVAVEDSQKFALRDLIDQSLLAQRGKDMDINVEPEVVKQLDQVRQKNNLKDLDDLEKAVSSQGINWEDFKNNIKNRILTSEVIRREVGSHINITQEEEKKFYEEHKKDFVRPEQVALSAIEIKTEGKKESEIPELKAKAQKLLDRVKEGEDFGELAKRFSDGATAQQGGYLGQYKRGELSKELEDIVFKMNRNQLTDVIETKQGFLVLKVLEHYEEGEQSFDKVENEIQDHLYQQKMDPALREYLKTLREQSYVVIKPGYQDMAGGGNSEIQEVNATPEVTKEKKGHKKYLLFGKNTGAT